MADERPSNDPGHVGPRIDPGWLDVARQVVMFGLGVWLIVHAATTSGHDIPFLVTGVALFGMIPIERVVMRRNGHRPPPDDPPEPSDDMEN